MDSDVGTKIGAFSASVSLFTLKNDYEKQVGGAILTTHGRLPCLERKILLRIKYTGIIANCIMLDSTAEINNALNVLAKEGLIPTIDELAALSPYQTRHIKQFGNYELDLSAVLAPITDDLTFTIELPPQNTNGVERSQDVLLQTESEISTE